MRIIDAKLYRIARGVARRIRGLLRRIHSVRRDPKPEIPQALLDFNEFCSGTPSKRALISFLVGPVEPPFAQRDRLRFSLVGAAQEMYQALNELGYVVDIVQWDCMDWTPSRSYDLFIGHGGVNFEHISRALPVSTIRIYFSTSIYWKEFNIQEARRVYELALRRGYLLPPDRAIQASEEYGVQIADGIITLGNQAAVQTYQQFPLVIGINNAAYPVAWAGWEEKDFHAGRRHFLFFSGDGNIHKGLDLLLEAFADTELHLHICQAIDTRFAEVYHHELTECPNIHVHGQVRMRSPQFESLVTLCNWVISATCADGSPGATVECMGFGLIPILPPLATIDLGEFGVPLPDCTVQTIRTVASRAAQMSAEECRRRSVLVSNVVREEYSPERFNHSFKAAVQKIVSARQQGS